MKILMVDDDPDLLDVTAYALRREGFTIISATDGMQALQRWQVDQPDLIILDVGLPRLSGFEVCRKIRQDSTTPIIMLTALNDDDHVVQGFRMGADDYITKPFSPRQLVVRIRALWRRAAAAGQPEPVRELRVADMTLDIEAHAVQRDGETYRLTPLEFRILFMLASNAGRVVSSSRLVEYAWGYDGGDVALLKTHISHIRKKLELPSEGGSAIRAISGVGYQLIVP